MVWKHNGREIKIGKSWVSDSGVKHPSVWARWSDSEKRDNGLTWEDPPASEKPVDNRFYLGRKTDGTLIEKSLDDTPAVDSDGKEIIDPRTDKQLVYTGLKSHWIAQTKETANIMLAKTDWMITRKYEKGTAIPSDTTSYRDSIRTACNTIETKINNCTKLSELMALFDTPLDSEGVATGQPPIFDFPEES